jgi:uncharacterized RDD family membrane protein YckC
METAEPPRLPYASIPARFAALFLDGLLLFIPCWVAGSAMPILGGILIAVLYVPVLESSRLQATFGKHWMGIQVTDLAGNRITVRTAMIRYLMRLASSFLLFLGHFLAFFTSRKQALHDLVAETVVVRGKTEAPLMDTWFESVKALFGSSASGAGAPLSASKLAELERLQALREKGALTETEFAREKQRILNDRD